MTTSLHHLPANAPQPDILQVLQDDGAVILDNVLSAQELITIKQELAPYLGATGFGRDAFSGRKTQRVGALVGRSDACAAVAEHALILQLCDAFLSPFCDTYQLHFTQAVGIAPDEGAQPLHRDRGVWGTYLPRSIETQFSTIWAIDDFTEDNGATWVVPGSHHWPDEREPQADETCQAIMQAGSVLLYGGAVIHGGGANHSSASRLALLLHYTLGWLRQEENQYLSCPPEVAARLSPRLRALLGYSKGGYVLGFFSEPVPGGEGLELAPPELLFGDPINRTARVDQLAHTVAAPREDLPAARRSDRGKEA